MISGGGWQRLRDCNCRQQHRYNDYETQRLGFLWLSASMLTKPPSLSLIADNYCRRHRSQLQQRMASSRSSSSKSPGQIPILADSSSQPEERGEMSAGGPSSVAGGVVALGKFDALHIGHRQLAIQASKVGIPYLLSFVGMAEVFGWEPRAPIVAECDRNRVLSSWTPCCGNIAPAEFQIEFSSVRHLTPRQFVEKLSVELGVCGVVAGQNYRFGYKAAGDASDLARLCMDYGMGAYIVNSVMDKNQVPINMESSNLKERGQVSSTRVRHALAAGDMKYVSDLLGRKHRLMLMLKDQKVVANNSTRWRFSTPKSCLLNLPPKDGVYENCCILVGNEHPVACTVSIDETHIHLDGHDLDLCNYLSSQDFSLLGIEFGN